MGSAAANPKARNALGIVSNRDVAVNAPVTTVGHIGFVEYTQVTHIMPNRPVGRCLIEIPEMFVGRKAELEKAVQFAKSHTKQRPVLLLRPSDQFPGGTGKTALAEQV